MKTFVILLTIAHFVGDWLLQPRWMAEEKSEDPLVLLMHLAIVTGILACAMFAYCPSAVLVAYADALAYLLLLNAMAHGLIDWFIWRVYGLIRGQAVYEEHAFRPIGGEERVKHDYPFYATIAVDQVLHLSILFLIFIP